MTRNPDHVRLASYAAAVGIALDCLADECAVEQLMSARVACDELDAEEAAAQLGHFIDARIACARRFSDQRQED